MGYLCPQTSWAESGGTYGSALPPPEHEQHATDTTDQTEAVRSCSPCSTTACHWCNGGGVLDHGAAGTHHVATAGNVLTVRPAHTRWHGLGFSGARPERKRYDTPLSTRGVPYGVWPLLRRLYQRTSPIHQGQSCTMDRSTVNSACAALGDPSHTAGDAYGAPSRAGND
jgi:hypothetical protein